MFSRTRELFGRRSSLPQNHYDPHAFEYTLSPTNLEYTMPPNHQGPGHFGMVCLLVCFRCSSKSDLLPSQDPSLPLTGHESGEFPDFPAVGRYPAAYSPLLSSLKMSTAAFHSGRLPIQPLREYGGRGYGHADAYSTVPQDLHKRDRGGSLDLPMGTRGGRWLLHTLQKHLIIILRRSRPLSRSRFWYSGRYSLRELFKHASARPPKPQCRREATALSAEASAAFIHRCHAFANSSIRATPHRGGQI